MIRIAVFIIFVLFFSGCEDKKEDKKRPTFIEKSPKQEKQKQKSVEDWKKGKEQRLKDMNIKIKNAEKIYKKRVL